MNSVEFQKSIIVYYYYYVYYTDYACKVENGKCQLTSKYCSGSYDNGLCGGPANRKCCISWVKSKIYSNIHNPCPCVFYWRRKHKDRGIDLKFCMFSKLPDR